MLPIALVVLAATILRIFLISRDSAFFAYDMGRDLLWAKDIVFYQTPTLIGPAASIWGVYFGPLWYYFLSIPLLFSGGNPTSAVFATAAVVTATGLIAFFLFRKYLGDFYALVFSTLILFNATLINISTFAFHANVLPLLTLLMIYFCLIAIIKKTIYISGAFLAISLMFHADPAPAVANFFIPVAVILIFKLFRQKDLKRALFFSSVAFLAPFIPQILFEIRNNFVQTKSLIAYFLGDNPSLSGQLSFFQRVSNRLDLFFDFFKKSLTPQSELLAVTLLLFVPIGLFYFFKNVKQKNLKLLAKINLYALTITFVVFTVIVTVEVKDWYLYGLPVIFASIITFALIGARSKLIAVVFSLLLIFLNIIPFLQNLRSQSLKNDPALLSNQIAAIDLIYDDAKSNQFSVYTFTPSIYDLNYQYLFWWQGEKLKRGLPQDFAYLPKQPAYVRNKEFYQLQRTQSDLAYLILENATENEFYTQKEWLKNFSDYQEVWEKHINDAIAVKKLIR